MHNLIGGYDSRALILVLLSISAMVAVAFGLI